MIGNGPVDLNLVRSQANGELSYETKLQVMQGLTMQATQHTTEAANLHYLAELVKLDMEGKVERS